MRRAGTVLVLVGMLLSGTRPVGAESRPLKRLPEDVLRWSTLWLTIPQEMVAVGRDEGAVSALVWGPVKGTAVLVNSTTEEVWGAVKPDQPSARRDGKQAAIGLRYEF